MSHALLRATGSCYYKCTFYRAPDASQSALYVVVNSVRPSVRLSHYGKAVSCQYQSGWTYQHAISPSRSYIILIQTFTAHWNHASPVHAVGRVGIMFPGCTSMRACVSALHSSTGLPSISSSQLLLFVFFPIAAYTRDSAIDAHKKVKVARTRLPSVWFRSWSRFLAVSLKVTWVINPAVGCHYFPPGLQLPSQPLLRGLLPISVLGEQRHDGFEQFA